MSDFSLVMGRYLFRKNSFSCTVSTLVYAQPLLAKLQEIESEKGADVAAKVLKHMAERSLNTVLLEPSELDKSIVRSHLASPTTRRGMGMKRTCIKCSNKFYDLEGKIVECPTCKTPY